MKMPNRVNDFTGFAAIVSQWADEAEANNRPDREAAFRLVIQTLLSGVIESGMSLPVEGPHSEIL